jgi:hypothetical protein
MGKSKKEVASSADAITTAKTPFPKGLSQPALRALARAGYENLEQLSSATEGSLLALHGFGPNALAKLRAALRELGLSFVASD